jgi:hypothetical protein
MIASEDSAKVQALHLSPLLRKLQHWLGETHALASLKQLAVERGCNHYQGTFEPPPGELPPQLTQLSNEELGVALCLPHFGQTPNNLRIAAEIISAKGVSSHRLAHLAAQERCVPEIAYIARCGQAAEAENSFWTELLAQLPKEKLKQPIRHMPHWSRFAILAGMDRKGEKQVRWLRPATR